MRGGCLATSRRTRLTCSTSRVLKDPFDHLPVPLSFGWLRTGAGQEGGILPGKDRQRGFAPLHTPLFISLLEQPRDEKDEGAEGPHGERRCGGEGNKEQDGLLSLGRAPSRLWRRTLTKKAAADRPAIHRNMVSIFGRPLVRLTPGSLRSPRPLKGTTRTPGRG